ncbi:MAG: type II secretion system major pseudopilin GspG [Planctomycetota bacterium]
MRRTNKNMKRKSAFTLIEVLLVAGILAVLAAFAIPSLMGQAEEAKIKITQAAIGPNGPIAKALNAYKWDMGTFPESDEGLEVLMQSKDEAGDERYKGPYIDNDEIKDPWNQDFIYKSPGDINEDGYDLYSMGPDQNDDGGKEGSDDIKNWREQ